jgi:hypothetical protein
MPNNQTKQEVIFISLRLFNYKVFDGTRMKQSCLIKYLNQLVSTSFFLFKFLKTLLALSKTCI